MSEVELEISYNEIFNMRPPVPLAVQIRQKLNKAGFKFKDDGQSSSIVNENPEPLGIMTYDKDYATKSIRYRQTLSETAPQNEKE